MARLGLLLVAAAVTGLTAASQLADATRVLADMRQAPGGDAIAGVRAFSVETTEERFVLGRSMASNEVVAKQVVTDTRLGKFKINPEIDPKRFDASR